MRLAVNIDHVATVRQARQAREPDPVTAAALAELAGADGITVHLRGDRRHMQDRDLRMLRETVSTRLNVEMAATDEMMSIAADLRPDQVTLVPEEPGEVTTTGGLDIAANQAAIAAAVRRLQDAGIVASLFIDADREQITRARSTGANAIEINTGPYADATVPQRSAEIVRIQRAVAQAHGEGLEVLAGHGLTYVNVRPITAIPDIVELNIGHSLISRAVLVGLERAVREMIALMP